MDLFVYVPIRSRNVVFQLSLVIQQIYTNENNAMPSEKEEFMFVCTK